MEPKPKETPRAVLKPPKPKPTERRERERAQLLAEKREEQRKAREEAHKAREDAHKAKAVQAHEGQAHEGQAHEGQAHEGQAHQGKAKPSGADIANYRSIIYSQIAEAMAGVSGDGSASISFSVGANGRISGCSVGRSSGSGEFASLCERMRSIEAPAPPGGRFAGRITVRLHGS
jgi:outer membrane biosynthesis protein TonB